MSPWNWREAPHKMQRFLIVLMALAYATAFRLAERSEPSKVYDVIVDAGSSGSRIRVYESVPVADESLLPDYTETYNYKVEPGISQFKVSSLDDIEPYITELVDHAKEHVPEEQWSSTSIYLMATAGMRLLLEARANAVMWTIQDVLSDENSSPFQFQDSNARILSGEEEGAFAWITTNYLTGYFDDPDGAASTGIVEMGGASAQIAFIPDGFILANKFPVHLAGRNYPLYVHSLLYYGQNYADIWVKEFLYRHDPSSSLENPCMLKGDTSTDITSGNQVTFVGTGNPYGCMLILNQYVYKVLPYRCYPKPCSLGTTYQPRVPKDMQFFALGAYVYSLTTLGVLEDNNVFTSEATFAAAQEFCEKDIEQLIEEHPEDAKYLKLYCLMGLYIPTLSTKAYGFEYDSRQMAAMKKINGQPAEWPLGAVIYESQR